MKKALVARGFIGAVASLLGVVAVGCSADGWDEGAAGEGEIGSVAEALLVNTTASMVDGSGNPLPRKFAASCSVSSGGTEYLIVAGGFDPGVPSALRDYAVFKPSTGAWVSSGSLGAAGDQLMEHVAITDPANSDRCYLFGGNDNANGHDEIWSLTVNASGVVTARQQGKMQVTRTNFAAVECNGKILLMGGRAAPGSAIVRDEIEVFDPAVFNGAGQTGVTTTIFQNKNSPTDDVTLNTPRFDFAVAKDGDNILVAGGRNAGGALASVEAIKLDAANCELDSASALSTPLVTVSGGNGLSVARSQLAAFYDQTNAKFVIAAGLTTVASNVEDVLTVNFGTNTATRAAGTIPLATARPTFVAINASDFILLGGDNPGTTTAIARAQAYNAGAWTSTTTYNGGSPALESRHGATGVLSTTTGDAYVVGGSNAAGTLLATVDRLDDAL